MNQIFIYITLTFLTLYAWVGIFIFLGFYLPAPQKNLNPEIKFISILIAFRNEEARLKKCIESLKKLQYANDRYEFIFINDHSTDGGAELIQAAQLNNCRVLDSPGEGKKAAISHGVDRAIGELIVSTDADCEVPETWLNQINEAGNSSMILGPVKLGPLKNFLHIFQELEWAALQTISASTALWKKPLMNNGANLSYKKEAFNETALLKKTASGDDMFLLEDFSQRKLSIQFLWDPKSIVTTEPINSWKELFQQKIRWASKSKHYKNKVNLLLGILIALMNVFVSYHLINLILYSNTSDISLVFLATKMIVDVLLILPYLMLVNRTQLVFMMPIIATLYPFYFLYILMLSIRGKFVWKERTYHA